MHFSFEAGAVPLPLGYHALTRSRCLLFRNFGAVDDDADSDGDNRTDTAQAVGALVTSLGTISRTMTSSGGQQELAMHQLATVPRSHPFHLLP